LDRVQAENDILQARLSEYEKVFEEKLIEIKEDVRVKESTTSRLAEQLQRSKETIEKLEL